MSLIEVADGSLEAGTVRRAAVASFFAFALLFLFFAFLCLLAGRGHACWGWFAGFCYHAGTVALP